jgi:hypothetical protein
MYNSNVVIDAEALESEEEERGPTCEVGGLNI